MVQNAAGKTKHRWGRDQFPPSPKRVRTWSVPVLDSTKDADTAEPAVPAADARDGGGAPWRLSTPLCAAIAFAVLVLFVFWACWALLKAIPG